MNNKPLTFICIFIRRLFSLLTWQGLFECADIEQILLEAQNRWLRPPEICEILRNYQKFRIAPEPPNKPPSKTHYLEISSYILCTFSDYTLLLFLLKDLTYVMNSMTPQCKTLPWK